MEKHGSTGQVQLPFLVDLWNILFRCCIMLLIERIVSRDGESTVLSERIFIAEACYSVCRLALALHCTPLIILTSWKLSSHEDDIT